MNFAVSNIAWEPEHDVVVREIFEEQGVRGVELAPTKVFADPLAASEQEWQDYRSKWADHGIEVVALQALLFGRPDLVLFEDAERRAATLEHLRGMARVGAALGVHTLVFGSPKNRQVGSMEPGKAREIAVSFFRQVGDAASEHGVVVCIEPNPRAYGCDFITTSAEGLELVRAVDRRGFGLHLDAAALSLGGEDADEAIRRCAGEIHHFHASEPQLSPLGEGGVDHDGTAAALRAIDYDRWVSVEMRHDPGRDTAREMRRVVEYLCRVYGPGGTRGGTPH